MLTPRSGKQVLRHLHSTLKKRKAVKQACENVLTLGEIAQSTQHGFSAIGCGGFDRRSTT